MYEKDKHEGTLELLKFNLCEELIQFGGWLFFVLTFFKTIRIGYS